MRRKELIVTNSLIMGLVALFSVLTVSLSINQSIPSLIGDIFKSNADTAQLQQDQIVHCNKQAPLPFSNMEDDPYLVKLKEYQQVCQSFVTSTLMIFTGFPQDAAAAEADGAAMAKKLITFAEAGITPIVVAEPYATNGPVSYRDILSGAYDKAFDVYFRKIHDMGVTDQMMGTWVPFPESNTPSWNNKDTEPHDFAICVNKYLSAFKAHFPAGRGSILLNATTYDPDDLQYDNGDYLDLTPYVQDINKNFVTSIGIQGFPWVSNSTAKRREIFRGSEFLQPDLAIMAARELHTRDIWFNTGSFASKYTDDAAKMVIVSTNDRKAILSSILDVANGVQDYQQNGYRVSINLFAENKSDVSEATDWSYFQDADSKTILKEFLVKADDLGLPISLYDKTK